jgi:DNA-binding NarL/FixJ family response regulator
MSLHVIVCHELPVVRDGLCALLGVENGIEIVESTDSGRHVLALLRSSTVDVQVVLTGLQLNGLSAVELIRRVGDLDVDHRPQVVAFAVPDDDDVIAEVLHAGASGLLTEDASREDLGSAIRAAAQGDALLAPKIASRLVGWFRKLDMQPDETLQPGVSSLTPREREVLLCTAGGMSADEVARKLFIGVATVRTHLYRLRCKLEVNDRAQLVAYAYRVGLMRSAGAGSSAGWGRPVQPQPDGRLSRLIPAERAVRPPQRCPATA